MWSPRLAPLALSITSLGGCAAATSGTGSAADSLSALRPQYASTYVRTQSPPVLITHATILTAAGPELPRASILIEDGKITAVGGQVAVPPGAIIVDGTGKYVTPGV